VATSRVIGLDIGSSFVRAAELEFGNGGPTGKNPPTLVRYGQVPVPLGAVRDGEVNHHDVVATAIRQLWSQTKFSSKDVVIGVGNQRVVVRELDLPWMPLPQLKASLPYQVHELLPMSTDDALLDYFPTGESDGPNGRTVHGMLVAAQRDTVNANVMAVETAGLRPRMVDLSAFAMLRSLARGDLARSTVAFVDVGASMTTVVIAEQGRPRLVRSLPSGGQNVTAAVAGSLGISSAEAEFVKREIGIGFAVAPERAEASEAVSAIVRALVESVRNTLVYYSQNNGGAGVDMVVLVGGGAQLPGFGQYVASASRVSVVLGDPLAGLRSAKGANRGALNGAESLLSLSVGLAYGVAA
jgi:type IV pilus assembly protein PilM